MSKKCISPKTLKKNKVIAALAYAIFFLSQIVDKDSEYGKFHANQGLLLLIVSLVGNAILTISMIDILLVPLLNIILRVLFIMGALNAYNGQAKELPMIGKYRLLK
jgi:uncharacterized membrane protein